MYEKSLAAPGGQADAARYAWCPERPLISVHFPKSGGTSFGARLMSSLGREHVCMVYDRDPVDPANPMWLAPSWFLRNRPRTIAPFRVVHGHFPGALYDLLEDAARIVMLREPADNLISIYYYWKQMFGTSLKSHAVYEFVKARQLTLTEFAELPCFRRLMSGFYFGGYDMRRFDVIGVHDRRDAFRAGVSALIGVDIPPEDHENTGVLSEERGNVMADSRLLAGLRDTLADDVRFFEAVAGRFT